MNTDRLDQSTPMLAKWAADIAPCAPASYSITPLPGKRGKWLLQASGTTDPLKKAYPGGMFVPGAGTIAKGSQVFPNTGKAEMRLTVVPGADLLANGNVLELDVIFILIDAAGKVWHGNGSMQIHLNAATGAIGQVDIGNWTDSTVRMGQMQAGKKYRLRVGYAWNLTATPIPTFSVTGFACNGTKWTIPTNLPNFPRPQPMTPSNWTATDPTFVTPLGRAYRQRQLGLMPNGAPVSVVISKDEIRYW